MESIVYFTWPDNILVCKSPAADGIHIVHVHMHIYFTLVDLYPAQPGRKKGGRLLMPFVCIGVLCVSV